MTQPESQYLIEEARLYIEGYGLAQDDVRRDTLRDWALTILRPLAESGNAEAKFLLGYIETIDDTLDGEAFRAKELIWLREAAVAGIEEAQFRLACELDEPSTREESAKLFRVLAENNHPYAQWCRGLNLIAGVGCERDEKSGVDYIVRSANGRFEGAIQWITHAYAQGVHGFEKSEEKAAEWNKRLYRKDTIRY